MYQRYEFKDSNLMSFHEAKKLFITELIPRLKLYEERLKKSWLKRGSEYFSTGYGKEGYERTKSFITELEKLPPDKSTPQDLITLTAQKKYRQGTSLPKICRMIVLKICNFSEEHINAVEKALINEILLSAVRHQTIKLAAIPTNAIIQIYEKIVISKDCGQKYLCSLNCKINPKELSHLPSNRG